MTNCGIVDVRARINGKDIVDIEMQVSEQECIIERILFYWARMYSKQIVRGDDYIVLNRCISVMFIKDKLPNLSSLPIHTKWQIKECEYGKILLTDKLEIHIIEIDKEPKSKEDKAIQKWLTFLKNPYGRETQKMSEENEDIKVALEGLEEINADEQKVRIAELRMKYILDRNEEIRTAENKGKQLGRQEGIEIGLHKAKLEMIKKMKQKGLDIQTIIELTGLTEAEINKV